MNTLKQQYSGRTLNMMLLLAAILGLLSTAAHATVLNAPVYGAFTMNLDSNALKPYSGYFLSTFWDAADSNYSNPLNTGDHLTSQINTSAISAVNRVFQLTPIGTDPVAQADLRDVKATSANFYLDSATLSGLDSQDGPLGERIPGAQIGMTGVQGFYAPNWQTACCGLGGGLVNGDFSVVYDSERKTDGRSGWYLNNNIYFTMATYDFSQLRLEFTDADNWQLTGDLLMSPENGRMLRGEILNDVGDFCLGVGSYTGCGKVSDIPIPGAMVLFLTGLLGFTKSASRYARLQIFLRNQV